MSCWVAVLVLVLAPVLRSRIALIHFHSPASKFFFFLVVFNLLEVALLLVNGHVLAAPSTTENLVYLGACDTCKRESYRPVIRQVALVTGLLVIYRLLDVRCAWKLSLDFGCSVQ